MKYIAVATRLNAFDVGSHHVGDGQNMQNRCIPIQATG